MILQNLRTNTFNRPAAVTRSYTVRSLLAEHGVHVCTIQVTKPLSSRCLHRQCGVECLSAIKGLSVFNDLHLPRAGRYQQKHHQHSPDPARSSVHPFRSSTWPPTTSLGTLIIFRCFCLTFATTSTTNTSTHTLGCHLLHAPPTRVDVVGIF